MPRYLFLDRWENVYLVASTRGSRTSYGHEYLVAKYDKAGRLLWQSDLQGVDFISYPSAAADRNGNLYIAGVALDRGIEDRKRLLITKLASDGKLVWRQVIKGGASDYTHCVALDVQGAPWIIYAKQSGSGLECAKLDQSGHLLSTRPVSLLRLGPLYQALPRSAAIDARGNLYVVGDDGNLAGRRQGFIVKVGRSGRTVWVRKLPYQFTTATALRVSENNIFVSGTVPRYWRMKRLRRLFEDHLRRGPSPSSPEDDDGFVAKYDAGGDMIWVRLLSSKGDDAITSLAVGRGGSLYAGAYSGSGADIGPNRVPVVLRYETSGRLTWTKLIRRTGSKPREAGDEVQAVAVTAKGHIYVCGTTYHDFFRPNAGREDAFVARIEP